MRLVEHTELQLAEIMLGHVIEAHNIALTLDDRAVSAHSGQLMKLTRKLVADWRGRRGHEEEPS
jgi:hypothetical protein